MKTAGWSSAATFAKFYDKEIVSDVTFSDAVLGNSICIVPLVRAISCFKISRDFVSAHDDEAESKIKRDLPVS